MKDNKKNDIENKLDFENYNQLHNVTLKISNQCFEVKKIFLTIVSLLATLGVSVMTSKTIKIDNFNNLESLSVLLIIVLLFYFYDSYLFFYQNKMRNRMKNIELKIKENNNICLIDGSFEKKMRKLICESLINTSHIFYLLFLFAVNLLWYIFFGLSNYLCALIVVELIVISVLLYIFLKFNRY